MSSFTRDRFLKLSVFDTLISNVPKNNSPTSVTCLSLVHSISPFFFHSPDGLPNVLEEMFNFLYIGSLYVGTH